MSFLREDRAKIRRQLTQEAIGLAMQGRWEEAVAVNRQLLESFPTDVDAHNRLGRALMELGRYGEAREAYQRALELDPYNNIARKNVARLGLIREEVTPPPARHRVVPELFEAESGKVGTVSLGHPAPREVLAKLAAGDEVQLRVREGRLVVEDREGVYLGEVGPQQALRLIGLMEGGNRYSAAIARMNNSEVQVIIREVYQHPSQAGRPSFLPRPLELLQPVGPHYEEEEAFPLEEGEEEPVATVAEQLQEEGSESWEASGN